MYNRRIRCFAKSYVTSYPGYTHCTRFTTTPPLRPQLGSYLKPKESARPEELLGKRRRASEEGDQGPSSKSPAAASSALQSAQETIEDLRLENEALKEQLKVMEGLLSARVRANRQG